MLFRSVKRNTRARDGAPEDDPEKQRILDALETTGGNQTDSVNTANITALVGEIVTLSEVLGAGNTANYTTRFSCSGATFLPDFNRRDRIATLLIDGADTAITCTYTNGTDIILRNGFE